MELLFLGTSAGIPTRHRNVTALALKRRQSKAWVLIDCGEGTQHQLLNTSLSLKHLSAICITHVHGDHCFGLFGVLASAAMYKRSEPLLIIAPDGIQQMVELVIDKSDTHLPYPLIFRTPDTLVASTCHVLPVDDFCIRTVALSHRVPSYAYVFNERYTSSALNVDKLKQDDIPQGPLWQQIQKGVDVELNDGRRIVAEDYQLPKPPSRRVIVGGDNDTPKLLAEVAQTAQVLVHEATYSLEISQKVGPFPQHTDVTTLAQFAESVHLPNLIMTHFSARYGHEPEHEPSVYDLLAEAQAYYQGQVFLAEDFAQFYLDTNGVLSQQKTAIAG